MGGNGPDRPSPIFKEIGAKYTLSDLGIDESLGWEVLKISAAIRNRMTLCRLERLIVE